MFLLVWWPWAQASLLTPKRLRSKTEYPFFCSWKGDIGAIEYFGDPAVDTRRRGPSSSEGPAENLQGAFQDLTDIPLAQDWNSRCYLSGCHTCLTGGRWHLLPGDRWSTACQRRDPPGKPEGSHSLLKRCWIRGKPLPGPPRRMLMTIQVRATAMTRTTMRRGPGVRQTQQGPPQALANSRVTPLPSTKLWRVDSIRRRKRSPSLRAARQFSSCWPAKKASRTPQAWEGAPSSTRAHSASRPWALSVS